MSNINTTGRMSYVKIINNSVCEYSNTPTQCKIIIQEGSITIELDNGIIYKGIEAGAGHYKLTSENENENGKAIADLHRFPDEEFFVGTWAHMPGERGYWEIVLD